MEGVFPLGCRQWRGGEASHLRHDLVQVGFEFESTPANKRSPLRGSDAVCTEGFGQPNWGRVDCGAGTSKGRSTGLDQKITVNPGRSSRALPELYIPETCR